MTASDRPRHRWPALSSSKRPRVVPVLMGNCYPQFYNVLNVFRNALSLNGSLTRCAQLFLFFSGSSDDLCYETGGTVFDKDAANDNQESPQSPVSPRTGQRSKRERTRSLSKSAKSVTKTDPVLRTRQRTIYTSGRPPWYDTHGQSIESFVIGWSHLSSLFRLMSLFFKVYVAEALRERQLWLRK